MIHILWHILWLACVLICPAIMLTRMVTARKRFKKHDKAFCVAMKLFVESKTHEEAQFYKDQVDAAIQNMKDASNR